MLNTEGGHSSIGVIVPRTRQDLPLERYIPRGRLDGYLYRGRGPLSATMRNRIGSLFYEPGFSSLLSVLVAGVLLYFVLSPGTFIADAPEIAVPLGVLSAFVVVVYLLRSRGIGERLETRVCQFGLLGAFVGSIVGSWSVIHQLSHGLPIVPVYHEVLTALDVGILAGVLVGFSTGTIERGPPRRGDERERVLAESTWTNRPDPNPILGEIVEQTAGLEGTSPLQLEPLSAHIDPDVFSEIRDSAGAPWQVLFHTDKYEIRVSSHGTVTVYDVHGTDDGPVTASDALPIRWRK